MASSMKQPSHTATLGSAFVSRITRMSTSLRAG